MIVVIQGNIGCGKTTLLDTAESYGHIVFREPLNEWDRWLQKMYRAEEGALSLFQGLVLAHYTRVTAAIDRMVEEKTVPRGKHIFIERSPIDTLGVFLPLNEKNFQPHIYSSLVILTGQLANHTIWRSARYIYIYTPEWICFSRTRQRNRKAESLVELGYLSDVGQLYKHLDEKMISYGYPERFEIVSETLTPGQLYAKVDEHLSSGIPHLLS